MLDSEADFKARALEIGAEDAELEQLTRLKFTTFGKLAFACNYVPGQSDDTRSRNWQQKYVELRRHRQLN